MKLQVKLYCSILLVEATVAVAGSHQPQPSLTSKQSLVQSEMQKGLGKRILNTVGGNIAQAGVDLASIPAKPILHGARWAGKSFVASIEAMGPFAQVTPMLHLTAAGLGAAAGGVAGTVDAIVNAARQAGHKVNRVVQSTKLFGFKKDKAADKMINRELSKIEGKKLDKNVSQEASKKSWSDFGLNKKFDAQKKKFVEIEISQADDQKYYVKQQGLINDLTDQEKTQLKELQKQAAKDALNKINVDKATMILDRRLVKDVIKEAIDNATRENKEKIKIERENAQRIQLEKETKQREEARKIAEEVARIAKEQAENSITEKIETLEKSDLFTSGFLSKPDEFKAKILTLKDFNNDNWLKNYNSLKETILSIEVVLTRDPKVSIATKQTFTDLHKSLFTYYLEYKHKKGKFYH